ncbi:MAG: hypothetical protein WAX07_01495 [Candidatus Altiarchaeia archaeon]
MKLKILGLGISATGILGILAALYIYASLKNGGADAIFFMACIGAFVLAGAFGYVVKALNS